jgi:hypothetical protein
VFVRIERADIGIYSKQKRHWPWRVVRKRATGSGAFQTRHYQWRVVIRIFELIRFSLSIFNNINLLIINNIKNWII